MAYLYIRGVGRVDGDALRDEHPHIGRQVVDLGQIRPARLKQRLKNREYGIGAFFHLRVAFPPQRYQQKNSPKIQQKLFHLIMFCTDVGLNDGHPVDGKG